MKLSKLTLAALLLTGMIGAAEAAFNRGTSGGSAANFLRLGVGSRYLAMGEAATGVADDVNALYWNPANLARMNEAAVTLMQNSYADSANYQYGGFGLPKRSFGTFGVSVQRLSAGSIRRTDDTGRELGEFSPRDMALGLGWGGRMTEHWHTGLTAKYVQSKIVESDSTMAFDAGLGYKKNRVGAGFVVKNMGGELQFDQEKNSLPLTLQTGMGYNLTKSWLIAGDLAFPQDARMFSGIGTEYRLPLGSDLGLGIRAGYNTRSSNIDGLTGFSMGMGLSWQRLDFDYAWVPMGDLSQTHRVSLTLRFRNAPPPAMVKTPPPAPAPMVAAAPPQVDSDGDHIMDYADECPATPFGLSVDNLGCPSDAGKALPKEIWILRNVHFSFNSDKIRPESFGALKEAVGILQANPTVKVEVQGHADRIGSRVYNLDLSQRRALAVKKFLIQEGVASERLDAKGFGFDNPVSSNGSEEGRALNRRMEFRIIKEKVQ